MSTFALFAQIVASATQPREILAHAVRVEAQKAELRAIVAGMTDDDAAAWLRVLHGLQLASVRETSASLWLGFRHEIVKGATPVQAAAEMARRVAL